MNSRWFKNQEESVSNIVSLHQFTCTVCLQDKPPVERYSSSSRYRFILCKKCASKGKHCPTCEKYKTFSEFHGKPSSNNRGGVSAYCKVCRNQARREEYKTKGSTPEAREKERYQILARKYENFAREDYLRLFESQGGVCAVCGLPETTTRINGTIAQLAVDHNHETGQIRALLCTPCNISYGHMQEDPERIRKLLEYAEKWR